jgi:hypothetical protein
MQVDVLLESCKFLEQQVKRFIEQQTGRCSYRLQAGVDEAHVYVMYGNDLVNGIAGFGRTASEALINFKQEWHKWKGEEWIEKVNSTPVGSRIDAIEYLHYKKQHSDDHPTERSR